MKTTKHRNEYFDFLRGISIIFVVGIHTFVCSEGCSEYVQTAEIALRQILNCAVPLFLAISGFFLSRIDLSTREQKISFWKKQIPKVYIPALVWSIPFLYKSTIQYGIPVLNCLVYFFTCSYGVLYFVFVIIQMYLLLPYISKFCNKYGTVAFGALSLLSVFIMNTCYEFLSWLPLGFVTVLGYFPLWVGFFILGIYLSRHSTREYDIKSLFILLLPALCISVIEVNLWSSAMGERYGYKFSSFIFSYILILIFFSKKAEDFFREVKGFVCARIIYVGKISFGIYLLHYLLIPFLQFGGWAVNWIMVLLVTMLVIAIIKSLFPAFAKKYLGFY